jgi:oxalate decarboxylase/phosphoglucose isomerase-like protein (cupin superfamily)
MASVIKRGDGQRFGLPGRLALEIVGAPNGAHAVTLRYVEIPVTQPGEQRGPHVHQGFEECIYVLSGSGATHSDSGIHPLQAGDTILIPSGERHVTRNTGNIPLVLLCFFPINDIRPGTTDTSFPVPPR